MTLSCCRRTTFSRARRARSAARARTTVRMADSPRQFAHRADRTAPHFDIAVVGPSVNSPASKTTTASATRESAASVMSPIHQTVNLAGYAAAQVRECELHRRTRSEFSRSRKTKRRQGSTSTLFLPRLCALRLRSVCSAVVFSGYSAAISSCSGMFSISDVRYSAGAWSRRWSRSRLAWSLWVVSPVSRNIVRRASISLK